MVCILYIQGVTANNKTKQTEVNIATKVENKTRFKALLNAIQKKDLLSVKKLIGKGVNIHQKDEYHETVLMKAARQGNKEIISLILDKGAKITDVNNYGKTALMIAAHKRT